MLSFLFLVKLGIQGRGLVVVCRKMNGFIELPLYLMDYLTRVQNFVTFSQNTYCNCGKPGTSLKISKIMNAESNIVFVL